MRRYLALVWWAAMGAGWGLGPVVTHAATPENAAMPSNSVQPGGKSLPSGNPLWGVSLNSLTATRERPIFSPSRRPPLPVPPALVVVAPTPVPPPAAPEEIPLQLLGTIVGRDHGIAICLNPTTRDVIRLKMGEDFQGWVLRAVHGREAAFEKASLQVRLTLPSPDESASFETSSARPLPLAVQTSVPASETWTDGDGQVIVPPPFAAQAQAPASATWRDGDGQLIAPPPKSR